MIQATVIGNIGRSPEIRDTKNGKKMCKFSLASTNRSKGQEEPQTTWLECMAFDDTAEAIVGNLDKGMRVIASGSLWEETYKKRDGSEGHSLVFMVNDIGLTVRSRRTSAQKTSNAEPSGAPW